MTDKTHSARRQGKVGMQRVDLAVYAHRVMALLRPLDFPECDAVLRAAQELNRAERVREILKEPTGE